MLHKTCLDAGYDLSQEMVFLFLNPFDTSISSKLANAMFNLKEIEGALHYGMTEENEVEQYANKCVVHILLSPVANGDLVDGDELDHYISSILSVCKENRRLKYAFFLYKFASDMALLEHEMGKKSVEVLKKINSEISKLFS